MKTFEHALDISAQGIVHRMYSSYMSGSNEYNKNTGMDLIGKTLAIAYEKKLNAVMRELDNLVDIKWSNKFKK